MSDVSKDAGEGLKYREGEGTTEDAKDAKVEVEWGDNLEVILKVTCPKCDHVNRIKARDAVPGAKVECPCGNFTIELGGDDLRDVQRAADDIRRAFKNLSK